MAPELLSALECESHSDQPLGLQSRHPITTAVDVYSFGLVLWQIITGESLDRAAGGLRQPRCALLCRCSVEISEAILMHACQEQSSSACGESRTLQKGSPERKLVLRAGKGTAIKHSR